MAVVIVWTACEKDDEKITLDLSESVAPVLGDLSHIVLHEDHATDTLTISWSQAEYGSISLPSVTYRLNLIHADTINFLLTETNNHQHSLTVNSLNNRLLSLGFEPDVSVEVQFRVSSFVRVEDNGTMLRSVPVTATLTPFESDDEPDAAVLWVPGDYQGWSPETAPNIYSPEDNGIYRGYIHMESGSGMFKFITEPTWDSGIHYGTGGDGILDPEGGDLSVPENGTWYFTANTEELTWTHQLRNYALIGTFNDWADDEPLTWDNDAKVFTITMDFVVDDRFKWRANGAWAINYGIKDPDDGTLVQDGADITIEEAGNYTIILNLYNVVPTYELIKN